MVALEVQLESLFEFSIQYNIVAVQLSAFNIALLRLMTFVHGFDEFLSRGISIVGL